MSVAEISKNHPHTQDELDDEFYTIKNNLCYERVFGYTWVSPGGEGTAKEFFMELNLQRGQKVLDMGSGLGGAAFYLARQYGVRVTGVDYSRNMVRMANERRQYLESSVASKVEFIVEDVLKAEFPKGSFDAIYSRDAILHMGDKDILFSKVKEWLKPGGRLLVTDYCRGDEQHMTDTFRTYMKRFKFNLLTMEDYANKFRDSGFEVLKVKNNTERFQTVLKNELSLYYHLKDLLVADYGQSVFEKSTSAWEMKLANAKSGVLLWSFFLLTN